MPYWLWSKKGQSKRLSFHTIDFFITVLLISLQNAAFTMPHIFQLPNIFEGQLVKFFWHPFQNTKTHFWPMFPFYNPWKRQKREKGTSSMIGLTKIQKPGIEKVTQLWFWLLILDLWENCCAFLTSLSSSVCQ